MSSITKIDLVHPPPLKTFEGALPLNVYAHSPPPMTFEGALLPICPPSPYSSLPPPSLYTPSLSDQKHVLDVLSEPFYLPYPSPNGNGYPTATITASNPLKYVVICIAVGAIVAVSANVAWVGLLWVYRNKKKSPLTNNHPPTGFLPPPSMMVMSDEVSALWSNAAIAGSDVSSLPDQKSDITNPPINSSGNN